MEDTYDALVIGGGPVGLFAALCLNEQGVRTRLVDAEWERPSRSYACALHPETLRLLDEVEFVEPVAALGHRIDRLAVYRGSQRVAYADFNRLGGGFPHVLTLPQVDLEEALASALEQRGVDVLWRHEVTGLTLKDRSTEAIATPKRLLSHGSPESRAEETAGAPEVLRAEWVIAADGHYSPCRTALGIDTVGVEEGEAFAVFEFTADLSSFQHEAAIVLDGDSVNAFWPLGPSEGRWTFQMWDRLDEPASPGLLQSLVRARAPWFGPAIEQISWSSVDRFEHLIVSEFGRDRIWLAGDAAHATSPIGFQSMNRGFAEAWAAARLIGDALEGNGASPSELIRRFDETQQREWRRLLGIETRVVGDGALSTLEGARLVPCLPASGHDLDTLMAQLGLRFA